MKLIETQVGPIEIDGNGAAITRVRFLETGETTDATGTQNADPLLERAAAELEVYFAGKLREFTVPVAFDGARLADARQAGVPSSQGARATPFRLAVWNAIRSIPYGETRTYGDIARLIGKPLASRAVGQALNRNPVVIIVPCHRVVGGDGSLVGFGGGLDRKRALLDIERAARH